jgi:cytochrome c2
MRFCDSLTEIFKPRLGVATCLFCGVIATGCGRASAVATTHSRSGLSGQQLFERRCIQCHDNGVVGPPLQLVYGRRAGTDSSFLGRYSAVLRDSGILWDRRNLRQLLLDPQGFLPGVNMPSPILDAEAADLVVRYLESL